MGITNKKTPKRALLIIDMQEDFCPPNGSLAVTNGRDIAPAINSLMPRFPILVATQDWHPPNHVSFASNHPGKEPYTDTVTLTNPENLSESINSLVWPDHCVQGSAGAALIPELDISRVDESNRIKKGTMAGCEMYSGFSSPFRNPRYGDTGLTKRLRDQGVDEVWCVGLAADFCVRSTAVDAVTAGFSVFLVEECTKAVFPAVWEREGRKEIMEEGVKLVSLKGPEVAGLPWEVDAPKTQ